MLQAPSKRKVRHHPTSGYWLVFWENMGQRGLRELTEFWKEEKEGFLCKRKGKMKEWATDKNSSCRDTASDPLELN